jgi:7-cyano-7-deazaguanine synthase
MKTLVLLSGGIDSTVALALAVRRGEAQALSVDYGQTHAKELDAAALVAAHYGVRHTVQRIALPACALTGTGDIPDAHAEQVDATFVPGRNIVMLAHAIAEAQAHGFQAVAVGANADDNAGYPDCRPSFLRAMDEATRAGYGVGVWAPLVRMTKQEVIKLGAQLNAPLELTWSCYRGGHVQCGRCGACESNGVPA